MIASKRIRPVFVGVVSSSVPFVVLGSDDWVLKSFSVIRSLVFLPLLGRHLSAALALRVCTLVNVVVSVPALSRAEVLIGAVPPIPEPFVALKALALSIRHRLRHPTAA